MALPSARKLRLASGLVIFTFLTTHLLNHALGLVSLDAMNAGREWFILVWRSVPGTVAFYGAGITHFGLAMLALYRRRTLRMPAMEWAQIMAGLAIPFLIVPHAIGTRFAHVTTGFEDSYEAVIEILWVQSPVAGVRQVAAMTMAWLHGSIGLHFWLRGRSWYPAAAPTLYSAALLVPVLALLGFAQAGKEVADLVEQYGSNLSGAENPLAGQARLTAYAVFLGGMVLVFVLRAGRALGERRSLVRIAYPERRIVAVPRGYSVLEASRLAGIPHLSVCGGRGRCSTCRVRVAEGLRALPPPDADERATLARIGAPPDVRLACQLNPVADLAVTPLLPAAASARGRDAPDHRWTGEERYVAVLFCDLRGFTALSEDRLPFDVVYLLNRYFAVTGAAVERAGGRVDKFIGDGVMALFGIDDDPRAACRRALDAATAVAEAVEELGRSLGDDLDRPLRLAMGLHAGMAIIGEMGYGPALSLTAVGDVVNVASRLESLAKELDAELVVSDAVTRLAGTDLSALEARAVAVRGRTAPVAVHVLPRAATLAEASP